MFVAEKYQFAALTKLCLSLIIVNYRWGLADNFTEINLPKEHIPYYFNSYPEIAEKCRSDVSCPYKVSTDVRNTESYFHICGAHICCKMSTQ
jgi:hypothetical protein